MAVPGAAFIVVPGTMGIPDVFPVGTECSVLNWGDVGMVPGEETAGVVVVAAVVMVVVVVGLSVLW